MKDGDLAVGRRGILLLVVALAVRVCICVFLFIAGHWNGDSPTDGDRRGCWWLSAAIVQVGVPSNVK